ncbi:MAG: hypothetical protein IPK50_06200 [Fibrobacterota bacterium]|nr:MAG: hypothetical protein IPK50_06200 [Fibrobacterota bacterium]
MEGKAEGLNEGELKGKRTQALADARKMREHGISWEIITDVTGIGPEDLEANQTA